MGLEDGVPGQVKIIAHQQADFWPPNYGFAVQIRSEDVHTSDGLRKKYFCTWRDEQHRLMGFWHWGELVAPTER